MPDAGAFDVAIVGYGPVGATLAALLGRRGLSVGVLERDRDAYSLPRAVHFDGEVMRVFQSLGIAGEVATVARSHAHGTHFVNAGGRTLLVRKGAQPHGWPNNWFFNQPDLDAKLRAAVRSCANVQVMAGREVTGVRERAEGAELETQEGETFRAGCVVGCDGARSLVRRAIGSGREDLGLHQPWLVVDLILKRPVDLPEYTVQHCDPARPMTYCCVSGMRRRWELMLMPGDDPETIERPERVWRLLERWIGPADADIERAAIYTFHSVIARGWRKGRLLIAGDAAHQSPPFLGLGMGHGIRDAANLAWKLPRALRGGSAAETLLDSYESERAPHVRTFIELVVRLGGIIQTTDPKRAEERDRQFAAGTPTFFDYPQAQLGPGVRDAAPPPAGIVFPQPRLDDGRLMDEAIGNRFAVIAEGALLGDARVAAAFEGQDVALLRDFREARGWLEGHGARAVVLRPDRYVYGIASDAAGLAAHGARLRGIA